MFNILKELKTARKTTKTIKKYQKITKQKLKNTEN